MGICLPFPKSGSGLRNRGIQKVTRGEPRVVPLLSWGHLASFYRFFLAKRGTVVGKQQCGSFFGLCGRATSSIVSGLFLKCRFESRSMKKNRHTFCMRKRTARFPYFTGPAEPIHISATPREHRWRGKVVSNSRVPATRYQCRTETILFTPTSRVKFGCPSVAISHPRT